MTTLLVILAAQVVLFVLVGGYVVHKYNTLVELEKRYENAFSQIDVQLKRRYDLIPNLVETAKGYLEHEQETLEAVIEARTQAQAAEEQAADTPGDPEAMQSLQSAESRLSGSLGQLMVTVEDYPNLKANETMQGLMEELRTTENKIAFARQHYNDAVTAYNVERESFPTILLAGALGYDEAELFEVELEEERDAVEVAFS
jgi:LemA protein